MKTCIIAEPYAKLVEGELPRSYYDPELFELRRQLNLRSAPWWSVLGFITFFLGGMTLGFAYLIVSRF